MQLSIMSVFCLFYFSNLNQLYLFVLQGLSSRKIGATTLNSNSSRSHIIFTFVIESLCKVMPYFIIILPSISSIGVGK